MLKTMKIMILECLIGTCMVSFPVRAQSVLELTVDDAVAISLKKNRFLAIAERKVEEEKAGIGEARSSFFPHLSGMATYTRLDVAPYISLGKKSPFQLPPGSPSKITIGDNDLYNVGISIKQPLFTGFALKNSYEIAKKSYETASRDQEKVEMDIILQTREEYYNLLKSRKLVDISKESVDLMEAHITDLRNMLKVGMIAENDLLKAQVQLSETKLMKIKAENNAQLMQRQFCTVLGIPLTTVIELKTPLTYDEKEFELESIIQTALENRPELHSMKNTIMIAEKGVSLAKSQWYPQLIATYNYDFKRPNREYESKFYRSWTAILVAQLNIFDWGSVHYRVTQARLQQQQAEEGVKQLIDTIILDVNQAFLTMQESKQRINLTDITLKQAEENYRVTQKKFSQGLVTNTELLDANTALTRAKIERTTAISDYLTALALVERATGTKLE